MNAQQYLAYIEAILAKEPNENEAPYDNPDYFNYTKLNESRLSRWLKTQTVSQELKTVIEQIEEPQHWIVITEPWCGDAAHSIPFIMLAARENPLIKLTFELRDSAPNRIDQYLTHGGKSIPKLIIQTTNGEDLAVWGPRPEGCQEVFETLKAQNASFEMLSTALQNWYNTDKGVQIQSELAATVKSTLNSK